MLHSECSYPCPCSVLLLYGDLSPVQKKTEHESGGVCIFHSFCQLMVKTLSLINKIIIPHEANTTIKQLKLISLVTEFCVNVQTGKYNCDGNKDLLVTRYTFFVCTITGCAYNGMQYICIIILIHNLVLQQYHYENQKHRATHF